MLNYHLHSIYLETGKLVELVLQQCIFGKLTLANPGGIKLHQEGCAYSNKTMEFRETQLEDLQIRYAVMDRWKVEE